MKFAVMGSAHGHIYQFIEDMLDMDGEFVGVYNDNSELVSEIAEKYDVPIYKDLEELFKEGIEVAGTSAINNQKIGFIEACDRHGVHVIADKPIVVDEEQYLKLEKIVARGKIEVGLMLTLRFSDTARTVKNLIDEGAIGKLTSIELFNPHNLHPDTRPDWHFDPDQNGGIVVDLLIHSVDFYNWLADSEIDEFTGYVQKAMLPELDEFYDSSQFFVSSANGTTGYFRVDWHVPDSHWSWGDIRFFCSGTKGIIELRMTGDPINKRPSVILLQEGHETREYKLEEVNDSVTRDFVRRIKGENHIITHKDILDATKATIEFDKKAVVKRML